MFSSLFVTHQAYPPLQASKWLKYPVLLDEQEMENLISALGDFWIFPIGGISSYGEGALSSLQFLESYGKYISALKQGERPNAALLRQHLCAAWTRSIEAVYALVISETKQIIKLRHPVIQVQMHDFNYSSLDGKFRSMIKGADCIDWGLQFSYPQLYQEADMKIKKVLESQEFPNTLLFKQLQKWIRDHTIPTPFWIAAEEKRVNTPLRIGKACLEWIYRHPQLAAQGLSVF